MQAPDGAFDSLITGDESIVDPTWLTYPPTCVHAALYGSRLTAYPARHSYGVKSSVRALTAHYGWSSSVRVLRRAVGDGY